MAASLVKNKNRDSGLGEAVLAKCAFAENHAKKIVSYVREPEEKKTCFLVAFVCVDFALNKEIIFKST